MTPMQRTMSDIGLIALKHGLQREDLLGRSRKAQISRARQEAFYALRYRGWSFPRIGKLFGRDHSTIIDGFERHQRIVHSLPAEAGITAGLI